MREGLGVGSRSPCRTPCVDGRAPTPDPSRMREDGYFDVEPIRRRWARHLAGTHDATAALWAVLMFQAWCRAASSAQH